MDASLFVMDNFDEAVLADNGIEAAKRAEMAAPSVLLREEIEEKDGDEKNPSETKSEDDTPMGDGNGTDHLKSGDGEEVGEEQAEKDDPVADMTAEYRSVSFGRDRESISKPCGTLSDDVDRTYPGAEKPAAYDGIKEEHNGDTDQNIRSDHGTGKKALQCCIGIR